MKEWERAAVRQALATAGTAFAVASFHVPQPFLAVLAAQLIGVLPGSANGEMRKRFLAVWLGTFSGVFLLIAAPEQAWISLPLFCMLAGFGIAASFQKLGVAPAILFAMGIGGMFSAGIIFPRIGLIAGMAHASSLSIAVALVFFSWYLLPGKKREFSPPSPLPALRSWLIGLAGTSSLLFACLTLPKETVVMTIATMTTILSLELARTSPEIGNRSLGALLGVLVSIGFMVIVGGMGNDLGVFLLAFAIVMGSLEGFAWSLSSRAAMFRQAAALFAVAATMLPSPNITLFASVDRILAVVFGFGIAVIFFVGSLRLGKTVEKLPEDSLV